VAPHSRLFGVYVFTHILIYAIYTRVYILYIYMYMYTYICTYICGMGLAIRGSTLAFLVSMYVHMF